MKSDPSLANLSKLEVLNKLINSETQDAYEFVKLLYAEILRFKCSVDSAVAFELEEEVTVNGITFEKGEKVKMIMHNGLHYNTAQW